MSSCHSKLCQDTIDNLPGLIHNYTSVPTNPPTTQRFTYVIQHKTWMLIQGQRKCPQSHATTWNKKQLIIISTASGSTIVVVQPLSATLDFQDPLLRHQVWRSNDVQYFVKHARPGVTRAPMLKTERQHDNHKPAQPFTRKWMARSTNSIGITHSQHRSGHYYYYWKEPEIFR